MGLLMLGLVLAGSVAGLELYIVHTFRPEKFHPQMYSSYTRWGWAMMHRLGPWIEASPVHGLLFSLGLSIAIGLIFPAAGIAVMLAGVLSTIATQPIYAAKRKVRAIRGSRSWRSLKERYSHHHG